MADISQSRSSLAALRGVLNRERVEEIKEGNDMRKAFKAAELALEAYAKARDELRFADAGPLSEKAAEAVEGAWSHYRNLEVGWAFDQVAKLETSLASLVNGKRHAFFGVRRFFYADLRQTFQTAGDKLAFIKTWREETGKSKSGVLRQHVREAWDAANGAWDINAAIEMAGGLPGSWLFHGPILDVLNTEAKRLAKAADEVIKAESSKPAQGKVKARGYTWEQVVAMKEADFQFALPIGDAVAATCERVTAQRALATKLDEKGLKVEVLYSAYKAGKFNSGLTEAEIALITARFVAMETPKEERRKPALRPEAQAVAALADSHPDPVVEDDLIHKIAGQDPVIVAYLRKRADAAGVEVMAFAATLASPASRGEFLAGLARFREELAAAKVVTDDGNGNGKVKTESPKRKAKVDGKEKSEAKNDKPASRRLFSLKRVLATAEAED